MRPKSLCCLQVRELSQNKKRDYKVCRGFVDETQTLGLRSSLGDTYAVVAIR
jgi:hypothetical protein